ncbi:hypothetical protein [Nocardia wallacei]|uniref:hypothetical protein n=1 Tax=Nocardia wallacei TaxID=480035 RepID=UPI002458571F|nr:hypothetical protein [Nocardia wallacei]
MIPQQLTGGDAAAGVERLIAGTAPVRPVRGLRRGRIHVSWLMSSQRGLLVVKVLVGVGSALALRWREHERLCRAGAPVAPLLGFDVSCAAVGGLPLVVLGYLPGTDAAEALPGLDARTRAECVPLVVGARGGGDTVEPPSERRRPQVLRDVGERERTGAAHGGVRGTGDRCEPCRYRATLPWPRRSSRCWLRAWSCSPLPE